MNHQRDALLITKEYLHRVHHIHPDTDRDTDARKDPQTPRQTEAEREREAVDLLLVSKKELQRVLGVDRQFEPHVMRHLNPFFFGLLKLILCRVGTRTRGAHLPSHVLECRQVVPPNLSLCHASPSARGRLIIGARGRARERRGPFRPLCLFSR